MKPSFFTYLKNEIVSLKKRGRIRTADAYKSALDSFRKFRNDKDVTIDSISPTLIEDYEGWLIKRSVVPNTSSFYMRILRAAYNRAVDSFSLQNQNPFKKVYTGVDKTVKRAISIPILKEIRKMNLVRHPSLDYARDMFILSFCLRGMSLIDMAFLRKSDLRNGYVTYRRRKTGQVMTVAWTKEMQMIVDKYGENASNYLLPIIRRPNIKEIQYYRNVGHRINRALSKLGGMLGTEVPLTLYVARHSWASAAHASGIPVAVISSGLGHESESTTRIYLANLNTSVVDSANALVIASISD